MRYAGLIKNDFVNGEGVCVSLFMQGCPIHCPGCHNQESWDPNGGKEIEREALITTILRAINQNGIERNFSVLGGEPLAPYNLEDTKEIVRRVRLAYPNIKIFLWTGYDYTQYDLECIFGKEVDVFITGPFRIAERTITTPLIGSTNQHIYRR